jgi:hypothetical protein
MANEVNKKPVSKEEAFVDAYWAFKRQQRVSEPTPEEFGLTLGMWQALSHQVHIEFQNQATRHLPKPGKKVAA